MWQIIEYSRKREEINTLAYAIHGNHKKIAIKAINASPTWNDKSELLDGSYSVCNIQDYFQYIIKKHEPVTDNPPVRIYKINWKIDSPSKLIKDISSSF